MRRMIILILIMFSLFLGLGMWRASGKPLWNDEYFTLLSSTLGTSYEKMLSGHIGEGNNSPLFYFLQKLQCDLFAFHPRENWAQGKWEGEDIFAQIFLRIQPVIAIAIALCALFYYFGSRYSLLVGLYSLAVALSSFMLWQHWTEARPYALWLSLSTIQMLLLLEILKKGFEDKRSWRFLCGIHCLLALTASISMIQIVASSFVLWVFVYRRCLAHVFMAVIPLMICLFYYFMAPHYDFSFVEGPLALVNANIPKDRFFIFFMFIVVFAIQGFKKREWIQRVELKFFLFTSLMLFFFSALLIKLKLQAVAVGQGFEVSNRYFMPLTAVGIIAAVLFSVYLVQTFQSRLVRFIIFGVLVGLLAFRMHKIIEFFPLHKNFLPMHHSTP